MKLKFILLAFLLNQEAKGSWLVSREVKPENVNSQFSYFQQMEWIKDWLQEMKKSIPIRCAKPDQRPPTSKKLKFFYFSNLKFCFNFQ